MSGNTNTARSRRPEGAARCKESFGRPTSVRCELRAGHRGKHTAFAASAIFIGRIRWATGSKSAEVDHGG